MNQFETMLQIVADTLVADAPWVERERSTFAIHPAVEWAGESAYVPDYVVGRSPELRARLEALVLEWVHVPEDEDPARVAYTRDPARGVLGHHITGKLGGYIVRHFPEIPGHEVEKIVGRWRAANIGDTFEILTNWDDIFEVMGSTSAHSCMVNPEAWHKNNHPYRVYCPSLGWGLAIQRSPEGVAISRALVQVNDKVFGRIYSSSDSRGAYRCDQPGFRDWLERSGYSNRSTWAGYELLAIPHSSGFVAPYLDGDQGCSLEGDLFVVGGSDYYMNSTRGYVACHEGQIELSNGDWVDEDDAIYLESEGEYHHVDRCIYSDYAEEWYLRRDAVFCIDGEVVLAEDATELWDGRFVPDSTDTVELEGWLGSALPEDAQELECGDYVLVENAVCIQTGEASGEWHRSIDAVETAEGDQALRDECVLCEDGDYRLEVDCVEMGTVSGNRFWIEGSRVWMVSDIAFLIEVA